MSENIDAQCRNLSLFGLKANLEDSLVYKNAKILIGIANEAAVISSLKVNV